MAEAFVVAGKGQIGDGFWIVEQLGRIGFQFNLFGSKVVGEPARRFA
ncbi:hypothetical protein [Mycobacterium shimoidei]|nr:hypothetical protein [Mycobacterium shimoidei]